MQLQQTVNFRVESASPFRSTRCLLRETNSHYSFGAGVVKLNKRLTVRELFENALLNSKPIWLM